MEHWIRNGNEEKVLRVLKVLRFDGPMARGLWYRNGAAERPGFRRFKGEGIALRAMSI